MALFQPSNIIPSTFAGIGGSTIDVSTNVSISWQVNGNSPMTAFQIAIYDNTVSTPTLVCDTGIITSYIVSGEQQLPFYGVDNKGNPQQFTYAPASTTWASWGLSNGGEYKIIITQWWGSNTTAQSETQITQYSGSVFYTRTTPTITLKCNNIAWSSGEIEIANAQATFTAEYGQAQGDSIQAVRWQIGYYGETAPTNPNNIEILDDTGFINTSVLSYKYDGFFTGRYYAVKCIIETEHGVIVASNSSNWIVIAVSYTETETSGDLSVECMPDDSTLLSWNTATNIPGEISSGDINIDTDGYLNLGSGQNATWDEVDGESMNLPADKGISLAWEGKVGSIITQDYQITTAPTVSTETQTIQKSQSDYTLDDIKYDNLGVTTAIIDYNSDIVFCDKENAREFVTINKNGYLNYSVDGVHWSQSAVHFPGSGFHLAYGNGYFMVVNTTQAWISPDAHASSWTEVGIPSPIVVYDLMTTAIGYYDGYFIMARKYYETIGDSVLRMFNIYRARAQSEIHDYNWVKIGQDLPSIQNQTDDYPRQFLPISNSQILVNCFRSVRIIDISSQTVTISLDMTGYDGGITAISYGNNVFAALHINRIWLSQDLNTWTQILTPDNKSFYTLAFNAGYFLLVSYSTGYYYYSFDCETWQEIWFVSTDNYPIFSYGWDKMYLLAYNPYEGKWLNISESANFAVSFQLFYSITDIKNSVIGISDKLLNSWEYDSQSNIKNVNIVLNYQQNKYTATVETYEPALDITLTYTLYSDTSTADDMTFPFTQGDIAAIKEVSRTTGLSATISNTISAITFSDISIATPNAQAATTVVNVKLAIIYNNLISGGTSGQNIIVLNNGESNEYNIKLYDTFATAFSYGLKLSKNGTDIGTSALEPFIPSIGSYLILAKAFITLDKMTLVLYGKEVQNSIVSNSADITYTQDNITSVELTGAQVVDYLYIEKGNTTFNNDFTPSWDENTLFFANFTEPAPNQLQAGTVSVTGDYKNSIYRLEGNTLKPIANLATTIQQLKDYGSKSQQAYNYELFYLGSDSGFTAPMQSEQVCKIFRAYSLIEATQYESEMDEQPNLYHVVKVWRFGNNISAGSISNNNSPNWLTNFTPYRLRQPSSRLGESGTLQALLSNAVSIRYMGEWSASTYYKKFDRVLIANRELNLFVYYTCIKANTNIQPKVNDNWEDYWTTKDINAIIYEDTATMMQELKQASVSTNTFFLKDMKGNLYMVGISAPITQTINTKTSLQQVTISVPWEEVGDATNVSLIQTPEDSGWEGNN